MGIVRWNKEFVDSIRSGTSNLPITFEGIVGKSSTNKYMYKAKTQAWVNKVKEIYNKKQAEEIINS
jgi:hypothetical protein